MPTWQMVQNADMPWFSLGAGAEDGQEQRDVIRSSSAKLGMQPANLQQHFIETSVGG